MEVRPRDQLKAAGDADEDDTPPLAAEQVLQAVCRRFRFGLGPARMGADGRHRHGVAAQKEQGFQQSRRLDGISLACIVRQWYSHPLLQQQ